MINKAPIEAGAFYSAVADIIGNRTPIKADCGKLYGKKCCAVTDEITGMYLFPFEEKRYAAVPRWAKIYDTDFRYSGGKRADLFTCNGYCDRHLRPIACMIFPLVPFRKRGEEMKIITDPRGKGICPLALLDPDELDRDFVKAVHSAMKLLMLNDECREFIYSLSELISEEL